MKKMAMMSLALTATCVSAFTTSAEVPTNSNPWETLSQNLKVVNICDLTDRDLNEIMQGLRPETAVAFSAQTTLPIRFFLHGDLAHLIEKEGNFAELEIEQTFYARRVENGFILSTNLIDWKPCLEFITGNASVALTIQDGKPSVVFGSETNIRPQLSI